MGSRTEWVQAASPVSHQSGSLAENTKLKPKLGPELDPKLDPNPNPNPKRDQISGLTKYVRCRTL